MYVCMDAHTNVHIWRAYVHTYVVHRRNSHPLTINRRSCSTRLNKENILLEFLILSDCNQRILQMTNASEPICICVSVLLVMLVKQRRQAMRLQLHKML